MTTTKTLVSGIQPSGRLHIGNYFGAVRQFIDLQESYESFFMIVDLHALTTTHDGDILRKNTYDLAVDYLALGLHPEHATIFKQSDIKEHAELTWIFNTLVTVPFLKRAHAYKDKVSAGTEPTVGLFDYPVLMAADILLYSPDIVPVGSDQKQHIEYARDIAEKFNATYGDTFKLPKEHIVESQATVPGNDGQKMSKSYGNHLPLFATDEEITDFAMSVVTDSKDVDEPKDPNDTIVALYTLVAPTSEAATFKEKYTKGGMGYKEAKEALRDALIAFITPLRSRREEIHGDRKYVQDILEEGKRRAHEKAQVKMKEVYERTGLSL